MPATIQLGGKAALIPLGAVAARIPMGKVATTLAGAEAQYRTVFKWLQHFVNFWRLRNGVNSTEVPPASVQDYYTNYHFRGYLKTQADWNYTGPGGPFAYSGYFQIDPVTGLVVNTGIPEGCSPEPVFPGNYWAAIGPIWHGGARTVGFASYTDSGLTDTLVQTATLPYDFAADWAKAFASFNAHVFNGFAPSGQDQVGYKELVPLSGGTANDPAPEGRPASYYDGSENVQITNGSPVINFSGITQVKGWALFDRNIQICDLQVNVGATSHYWIGRMKRSFELKAYGFNQSGVSRISLVSEGTAAAGTIIGRDIPIPFPDTAAFPISGWDAAHPLQSDVYFVVVDPRTPAQWMSDNNLIFGDN